MRIVFMGTGDIGVPVLRSLLQSDAHKVVGIVTQPDKPAGRKMQLKPSPIKELAQQSGLEAWQPPRLRGSASVATLSAWEPELIVVMAYGQILPREILELPSVACLNLHASLLPRHRGAAPVQAAIEAGDAESGITVMYMGEGLDTGDILLQHKFALAENETGGSLHDRLAEIAPAALSEALDMLGRGGAPRIPQDETLATYAGKLSRENGRLDWAQSAETLERKIRAYNPWPGAFTKHGRHALKIYTADLTREASGAPGSIVAVADDSFAVATGDSGALCVREVQLEGKRRMRAGEFLRGNPLHIGDAFSPLE